MKLIPQREPYLYCKIYISSPERQYQSSRLLDSDKKQGKHGIASFFLYLVD